MARIAVGGFQHETNTFAPSLATLREFELGGEWPELTTGAGLPGRVRGMNLPIAGFIDEAERSGHRLLPTTWCSASPSSYVTEHAYEHVAGLIVEGVRLRGPWTPCTCACTERWWPSTSRMARASCCDGCARWSGAAFPSSPRSISTPTRHPK